VYKFLKKPTVRWYDRSEAHLLTIPKGIPSPPSSPPLAAKHASRKRGGAAYTITEECERLFCETLRAVFLGEGSQQRQDSLVMGVHNNTTTTSTTSAIPTNDYGVDLRRYSDSSMGSSPGMVQFPTVDDGDTGTITDYIEMWDYVGGIRFRGFVAEKEDEKAMFVFFDEAVIGGDLKAGYVTTSIPRTCKASVR
jgi:hypothetical protein